MESWKKAESSTLWRRAIIALGVLYFGLGLWWAYVEIAGGTPVTNALILSFFIAGPGLIVLSGGYRLPRTDIDPEFYSRILVWCLGAIGVMSGLLALYHLQPAASISNPGRVILIISAFVLVPSFAGGFKDARAKSTAYVLERSVDLLHKTENTANVGGWEIDPETMEIFWTQHLFEILEVPYDEEPPLDRALDVYHEDDRPIVENAIEGALDSGEPFDVEVRFRTPGGEVRWLWVQGDPQTLAGDVVSLRGAAQDITERKARERELKQRARQQQVVADLGQFALESDALDDLMREVTRQVADVLDCEYCKVLDLDEHREELLLRQGVGWEDGIVGRATVSAHEADSQAAYTLANNHPIVVADLETESRFSGPELLTNHDVSSGVSTIIGPFDEPWGILGVHDTDHRVFSDEDVNFVQSVANLLAEAIERHHYQEELEQLIANLEESNERLEQFAYAASHDLQEPLRMVSSYLQLIEKRADEELTEETEEFLEFAVDGADRMREMIDGLLVYSRVESQGKPLEPVDLNEVIADVRDNLDVQITESDADVDVEKLPRVRGDESQLRQVFQNLLSNAIEYRGEDSPRVQISAERNDSMWHISVRDEGIGIERDEQERIFQVFQRLQSRNDHGGSGIGLALCERIVERHGGDIWVESEPGEGSTFSFTLRTEMTHDE